MKLTQDLHIISKTKTEKENVIRVLKENGFNPCDKDDHYLCINVDCVDNGYMTCIDSDIWFGSAVLTYTQFMEKYAMSDLKKKIEEAKKVTGLSASALSEKLGFQHKYLTNAVREASTQRQKEIIDKLDGLIFKEENELTHDFEGKALNVNIDDAIMVSKDEYDSLKKELDHKNQVLDKRNAILEKHIDRVSELELQLKTTRQKFIDVVDQRDKEIKMLQNDCNHATNQYHGKCNEVARLESKIKNQTDIYLIIIVAILSISIMIFVS